jgi:hypothetical protein
MLSLYGFMFVLAISHSHLKKNIFVLYMWIYEWILEQHRLPFYRRHKIICENSPNGIKRGPKKLEKHKKGKWLLSLAII